MSIPAAPRADSPSPAPGAPPGPLARQHLAVHLTGVTRTFAPPSGGRPVQALAGVDVSVAPGSFTALVGPSGSGKSTLLHCAAGLERCDDGSIELAGADITRASRRALAAVRSEHVGFIFQEYNLIASLTVRENIELPLRLRGGCPERRDVDAVLARVGLGERGGHCPSQLSGGEQQRVAIARVLLSRPSIVFADEPTGALDVRTGRLVLDWLADVAAAGSAVVMVTHDPRAAARADRVLVMAEGRIVREMRGSAEEIAAAVLAAQAAQDGQDGAASGAGTGTPGGVACDA